MQDRHHLQTERTSAAANFELKCELWANLFMEVIQCVVHERTVSFCTGGDFGFMFMCC